MISQFKNFLDIADKSYARFAFLSLFLIFFTGIFSIFYRAPMSWLDEQVHYTRAIQLSNGDFFVSQDGDMARIGGNISKNQKKFLDLSMLHFEYPLRNNDHTIISFNWAGQYPDLKFSSEKEFVIATSAVPYTPAVYSPYILAIKLNSILHLDAVNEYKLMKIFGFFSSFLMILLSIRVTPYGKLFFVAIGLIPTTILTFSSITADAFSFSIAFLFIAYSSRMFYKFSNSEKVLSKDFFAYFFISLGVVLSKMPAFLMISLYLPLLYVLTKNKRSNKTPIQVFLICSLVFFVILTLAWAYFVKDVNTGAYWGKADVNTFGQINYILSNIFSYFKILISSIFDINPLSMQLGYADYPEYMDMPHWVSYLFLIGLAFLFFIRDSHLNINKRDIKVYASYGVFLYLIITILIFSLLYLQFTPVGANRIEGVQPRYFIPYLLLLMLAYPKDLIGNKFIIKIVFLFLLLPTLIYIFYFGVQLYNDRMSVSKISIEEVRESNFEYAGYVDHISKKDNKITIIGWSKAQQHSYLLVGLSDFDVESIKMIQRNDVSTVMSDPKLIYSGFEMILSSKKDSEDKKLCLISNDKSYGTYKLDGRQLKSELYSCE